MKKLILFLMIFAISQATFAEEAAMKGDIKTKRLVEGTILKLKLLDPVTTSQAQGGEEFSTTLTKDISVQNTMILPAGTVIRGNVSKIKPARRLSKGAVLYLNFDHIVTTTGRQLPIRAGVYGMQKTSVDGGIEEGGTYKTALIDNWRGCGKIVKSATSWGVDSGGDIWGGAGRVLLVPIGAIGGTIGGGFYLFGDSIADLFRKGGQVILNQGDIIEIMLLEPVDVPV